MPDDIVTIFKRLTEAQLQQARLHASIPMPAAAPSGSGQAELRQHLRWAVDTAYLAGLAAGAGATDTLATMLSELTAIGLANIDRQQTVRMLEMALSGARILQVEVQDTPHTPAAGDDPECMPAMAFLDRMVEGAAQCALAGADQQAREALLLRVLAIGTGLMADTLGWNATMDALGELQVLAADRAEEEGPDGTRWQ